MSEYMGTAGRAELTELDSKINGLELAVEAACDAAQRFEDCGNEKLAAKNRVRAESLRAELVALVAQAAS